MYRFGNEIGKLSLEATLNIRIPNIAEFTGISTVLKSIVFLFNFRKRNKWNDLLCFLPR